MKAVLANDHGGLPLRPLLLNCLKRLGVEVLDLGVINEESVDYPDIAQKATEAFKQGSFDFGVLMCGTGIGISIAANKIDGIRCALPQNAYAAAMAKRHNNVNFIAFGGRVDYCEPVEPMLEAFIKEQFEGGRHERRVEKITELEQF